VRQELELFLVSPSSKKLKPIKDVDAMVVGDMEVVLHLKSIV
jgi:hypothetical protein